jgi:hypothetical protein
LRQEASKGGKPKEVSGGEAWLNSKTPDGTPGDVPNPAGEAYTRVAQLQEGSGVRKGVRHCAEEQNLGG